jgi:tRNA-dihydrouridine synthase
MKTYYQMLVEREEPDTVGKMKQFASYFTHGIRDGARLRRAVYGAATSSEILGLVDEFFAGQLAGAVR